MSIRNKLIIFFAIILLAITGFNFWYFPSKLQSYAHDSMKVKIKTMAEFIALGTGIGLGTQDFIAIDSALKLAKQDISFSYIGIFDTEKEDLAQINPNNLIININEITNQNEPFVLNGILFYVTPILYNKSNYGHMVLALNFDHTNQAIKANQRTTLLVSTIIFFISLLTAFVFSYSLVKQLNKISNAFKKIKHGNFSLRIEPQSGEIGAMANDINSLLEGLQSTFTSINLVMQKVSSGDLTHRIETTNLEGDLANLKYNINNSLHDTEKKNNELLAAQIELEERSAAIAQASQYKTDFMANMSHELRTPLNSLLLLAELLMENEEANLSKEQIKYASIIHKDGIELLSLINEILDLAKVESGEMDLHREDFKLEDIADYIKTHFQHFVDKKNLTLSVSLEPNIPTTLNTDLQCLKQILKNFLSNAIKFTHEGGINCRIWQPNAEQIAFSVEDSGIGIPEDKQDIVFHAFKQADGSTSREYGGTGLGLSICKQLSEQLEGEITLQSRVGKGSTFILYLPSTQTKNIVKEAQVSKSLLEEEKSTKIATSKLTTEKQEHQSITDNDKTLLIIDDDPNFVLIVKELAEKHGFNTFTSNSGKEGLALAFDKLPSAIILDIVGLKNQDGWELNGWEVMEELKNSSKTRHIPVHFISVLDNVKKALDMGAIGLLNKPVKLDILVDTLEKIENAIDKKLKHLLIVEDSPGIREGLGKKISNNSIEVTLAETGHKAYELLTQQSFDCVVLDLGLDDISGMELLQQLNQEPSLEVPPVIVYTGKSLDLTERQQLEQYTRRIIIKGKSSTDRLLSEIMLFLHLLEDELSTEQQESVNKHDNDQNKLAGKTLLLVDDDVRNSFALGLKLESSNINILQAFDGERALELLEQNPNIDAILMDIMMPTMDGYETIRKIRQQEQFNNTLIMALTAKNLPEDKERCLEAGANVYLTKPVDVSKLLSFLRIELIS